MEKLVAPTLAELGQPQQERLFYLEFRLYFLGHANRSDLQNRFGLKESSASRDIALYKKLAPDNVLYDYGIKSYVPQEGFKPLYSYTATQVLTALTYGFGDDYAGPKFPEVTTESPAKVPLPYIPTLAAVTRAIHKQRALSVEYISDDAGQKVQAIVPHALIESGNRWMIRAYNRATRSFDDFVINRIVSVLGESDKPEYQESKDADLEWNQIVNLTLKAHPTLKHPQAVEQEYGMHDGVLTMTCRNALKKHLLSEWRVDTGKAASTEPGRYLLWMVS